MKTLMKILKWTGIVFLLLVVILSVTVASRQNLKFDAPYPEIKASTDSAVIERGKNLVYGPMHCAYCHTTIDKMEQVEKGEILPLSGGHDFALPIAHLFSANITSDKETGIGKLTDGEIARTLRYGVGSDGRAIFDFMPFQHTSEEDLTAVISYLRSTAPVSNPVPENTFTTLGKVIKAFLIKPVSPSKPIPASVPVAPTVEYGSYLANSLANCRGCHTNRDLQTGAYIGKDFSGGLHIESDVVPGTFVTTPNLTPDPETGKIYGWDLDKFMKRFRQGRLIPASIMPWGPFSRMSDVQLEAIYRYLQTLEPVKNDVGPIVSNE